MTKLATDVSGGASPPQRTFRQTAAWDQTGAQIRIHHPKYLPSAHQEVLRHIPSWLLPKRSIDLSFCQRAWYLGGKLNLRRKCHVKLILLLRFAKERLVWKTSLVVFGALIFQLSTFGRNCMLDMDLHQNKLFDKGLLLQRHQDNGCRIWFGKYLRTFYFYEGSSLRKTYNK